MHISISIRNIQHISKMDLSIDLNLNKLTCIVGKNGVGKTTLVKAIQNLQFADTFPQTSASSIFYDNSNIIYTVNGIEYSFTYNSDIRNLNSKKIIPSDIKKNIDVELPMPYGQRFNFFQDIIKADLEIRRAIVLNQHEQPTELITMLNSIYSTDKFNNLIKITIKKNNYFCILLENKKYIREDYLSSGEFFLISLYRKIKNNCKLIVIDELDISLDAAAQTKLAPILREFCAKYCVNIFFTTHSLALIKTLADSELYFLQNTPNSIIPIPASYNYIKSRLYGFKGWDKYILTEDAVLKCFIEHLISKFRKDIFFEYNVIYIGGGQNVVDLMSRNATEGFFSTQDNVISILDGDQLQERHVRNFNNVFCIPFQSVEKQLFKEYRYENTDIASKAHDIYVTDPKTLYKELISRRIMSDIQINEHLFTSFDEELEKIIKIIKTFLCNI